MAIDLILRNAKLASTGPESPLVDIGVQNGRIVAVEPHLAAEGPPHDAGGKLVSPGRIAAALEGARGAAPFFRTLYGHAMPLEEE